MALDKNTKETIVKEYGKHDGDTGSTQVQIALLTKRIQQLTEHFQTHIHDEHSRRGLLQLVGQRRRLLRYMKNNDTNAYIELTDRLKLRR